MSSDTDTDRISEIENTPTMEKHNIKINIFFSVSVIKILFDVF